MAILRGDNTTLGGGVATTTRYGAIRLSTDAEAAAGAEVIACITPDQLQEAVANGIGSIVGGLTYRGLYDASIGVPDLSNAVQGDFYKVSAAGDRYGQDWQVGDHLVINADMGGTVTDSKIDKVDNTESISVLGDLIDVTLADEVNRQALVYSDGEWVNGDIIYIVDDLEDVSIEKRLKSVSYTSSLASATLVDNRDHVVDCRQNIDGGANYEKVMTLPSTHSEEDTLIIISNIGGSLVEIRPGAGTYFPGLNTTPITMNANTRAIITGSTTTQIINQVEVTYLIWNVSFTSNMERQLLASANDTVSWGNDFLNVSHIAGAARAGEIDTIESAVGLRSDGTFLEHSGTNYLDGTTTMRGADIALDTAIKSERDARISGDANLQGQINTTNANLADTQAELDQVEASVGLENDGTLSAWGSNGDTINATSTVKAAIIALDEEMAEVRELTVSGVDNLQAELDNTQASLGGMTAGGTFTSFSGTTYLDGTSTFRAADIALDTAIKAEVDTRTAEIADHESRISTLESTDPNHQDELDAIEAAVGLDANGDLPAWNTTGNTIGSTTTIKAAVEALDGEMEEVRQLTVGGIDSLQAELDNTQAAVGGMTASGTFSAPSGTNFIDTSTSLRDADIKLDNAIIAKFDESIAYTDAEVLILANTISDLQAELDATQTGAGLEADGSWVINPGAFFQNNTNYGVIDSMHTAVDALDYEIYTIYEHYIDIFKNNWIAPSNGLITISDDSEFDATDFDLSANNTWRFVKGSYTVSSIDPNQPLVIRDPNVTFYTMGSGTGASSVSEFKFPLTITGNDSIRNVFNGFQIEGLTTVNGTLGKHRFINCQLLGGLTLTGMQDFIVFKDCDITGDVTIDATFAGAAYFINCDFDGITSFTNNALPAQVIVTECKLFPLAAASSVTPLATMSFDDQSVRFIGTHISLPSAPAFTGNVSELNDDVGYITGNQAPVQSVNTLEGDVVLDGDNIISDYSPLAYTVSTGSIDDHLLQIDTKLHYLGTAATKDVGTDIGNVVQIIDDGGVPSLPAIDGSNLLNVSSVNNLGDLSDVVLGATITDISTIVYRTATGEWNEYALAQVANTGNYADLTGLPSLGSASPLDVGVAANNVVQLDSNARLPAVDASQLTNLDLKLDERSINDFGDVVLSSTLTPNDALVFGGTTWNNIGLSDVAFSGEYVDLNGTPTTSIGGATFITDADPLTLEGGIHYIMGTATGTTKVLTLPSVTTNGDYVRITNWGNGELLIQANQADPNAYLLVGQDIVLNGQVTVESKATIYLYGFNYSQGGTDYTPAWGIYFSSSLELNTKSFTTSGQLPVYDAVNKELVAGDLGDLSLSYDPTNYDNTLGGTVSGLLVGHHLEGIDNALGDTVSASDTLDVFNSVTFGTLADGQILSYDLSSQQWVNSDFTLPVASSINSGVVELATNAEAQAATLSNVALVPANLSSIDLSTLNNDGFLETANNLSELTATAATARTNLGLGTASVENVGTAIGDVVQLEDVGGNASLPAVDGSQLTGVLPGVNNLYSVAPGASYTVTTNTGAMETFLLTPTEACSVTLPSPATVGAGYMYAFKNLSTFDVYLKGTIDGQADFTIANQYGAVMIVSDGTSWYIL